MTPSIEYLSLALALLALHDALGFMLWELASERFLEELERCNSSI